MSGELSDRCATGQACCYVLTTCEEVGDFERAAQWLARVRDFRSMLEEHIRMEEDEVFPAFKQVMSEEQNARLTARMNKEGFKMA